MNFDIDNINIQNKKKIKEKVIKSIGENTNIKIEKQITKLIYLYINRLKK